MVLELLGFIVRGQQHALEGGLDGLVRFGGRPFVDCCDDFLEADQRPFR